MSTVGLQHSIPWEAPHGAEEQFHTASVGGVKDVSEKVAGMRSQLLRTRVEALKLQILNFGLMGGGVELGLSPLLVLHWKASKTRRCLSQAFIVLVAPEKLLLRPCLCTMSIPVCIYIQREKRDR